MSSLEEAGYREFEAWEIVRERYLFPPQEPGLEDEDDEPDPWADLRTEAIQLRNDFLKLAHEPDDDQ